MRPPLSLEEAVGLPEILSLSHLTLQELCHDVLASTRIRGPAGPASEPSLASGDYFGWLEKEGQRE